MGCDSSKSTEISEPLPVRVRTQDYQIERELQSTLYGSTYLATHLPSGDAVVLKSSELVRMKEGQDNPREESRILTQLNSLQDNNIVRIRESFQDQTHYWQVLELLRGGELFDAVRSSFDQGQQMPEAQVRRLFSQIMRGVKTLHQNHIAHLDLSLENILLTDTSLSATVKIIDFGTARALNTTSPFVSAQENTRPGKLRYQSPEIVKGGAFNAKAADIYSCGVILFAMLTGSLPYSTPFAVDVNFRWATQGQIRRLLTSWNRSDRMSTAAESLLTSMLGPEAQRPTADEVLASKWLGGDGVEYTRTP